MLSGVDDAGNSIQNRKCFRWLHPRAFTMQIGQTNKGFLQCALSSILPNPFL